MADATGIGWTDHTFNPWWGCEKVSPGCAHCYADDVARRYDGDDLWGAGHRLRLASESYWDGPLRWNRDSERACATGRGLGRRHRVFCLSMGDAFEERDDLEPLRRRLFGLIEATPWLDWQILTKRPEEARAWLFDFYARQGFRDWVTRDDLGWGVLPNVWVGVSIENARFTWRADVLREIPAAVRFISAEPLLGSLIAQVPERHHLSLNPYAPRPLDLSRIDWIIIGGESGGHHARPMRAEWAREIRDACLCDRCGGEGWVTVRGMSFNPYVGIATPDPQEDHDERCPDCHGTGRPDDAPALYFKQWGSHDADGVYQGPQPKAAGKTLDGVEWCEFPASAPSGQLALA